MVAPGAVDYPFPKSIGQEQSVFVGKTGVLGVLTAAAIGFGAGSGQAQSWGWAVYHDGRGAIYVAEMAAVSPSSGWVPLAPYTNQTLRQARQAACLLVTVGDLTNRKYRSPQIRRGEWSC